MRRAIVCRTPEVLRTRAECRDRKAGIAALRSRSQVLLQFSVVLA